MMILVTGGSGSGKSAYAEELCMRLAEGRKLYMATMQPYGEEGEKRIARHHALRAGKGFETIECYTGLEKIRIDACSCILLECMSNLVANEMFAPEGRKEGLPGLILDGIDHILEKTEHLIIVTNDVFSDGITYPEETARYQRLLAQVNQMLAGRADMVAEVVCGIPLILKMRKGSDSFYRCRYNERKNSNGDLDGWN